tara:strand:+ start:1914 stop:2636 length:723 start_codon:yes stop_codon:yes gene_type:complete
MAIPEMSGGAKGGMGNADLMSLLNNLPNSNFTPAQVAPAEPAPDFDEQLSSFYGDNPLKITQPYQDYYSSFPLPGDESRPAPAPAPAPPPVVVPPVRTDPSVVRNQGPNMNFNSPMVGTVEMPGISPAQFRYGGGGIMEDYGMGGGRLSQNIPIPQAPAAFDDPIAVVQTPAMQTPMAPSAPPVSFFDPMRNTTGVGGNIIQDFVPSMPILDAAPNPKTQASTRKKKKRTVRHGGGRRLS